MARREALACRKARTHYGPRLSARRPPSHVRRGKQQTPDALTRIAVMNSHVYSLASCPDLFGASNSDSPLDCRDKPGNDEEGQELIRSAT